MYQLAKCLLIDVIHPHLLCLTFDESAVERRMEERRVETDQFFVINKFLFSWCPGDSDSDKFRWLATKRMN
jgi:hypothetical protein